MKANVRANLGLVHIGETSVEAARHAASEVIMEAQQRVNETRAGFSSGRAVVKRGVVHSPFLLLVQKAAAKMEEDKAVRRGAREERVVYQERELSMKEAAAIAPLPPPRHRFPRVVEAGPESARRESEWDIAPFGRMALFHTTSRGYASSPRAVLCRLPPWLP